MRYANTLSIPKLRYQFLTFILVFISFVLSGQVNIQRDTIKPHKGDPKLQLKRIKDRKLKIQPDSAGYTVNKFRLDTTIHNKYGDLLDDDLEYNPKYPILRPISLAFGADLFTWSVDRLVFNAEFSKVSPKTWGDNFRKGWEWDTDRFGMNFLGHPYSGTLCFNAARANGYNYLESLPFAIGGSLLWEYFGENTRPSYNDIINTPVTGALLGEIFYRLSSNILDDRTTGSERTLREVAAGLIDPMRGLNRLIQGKTSRRMNREVYQKEPVNITIGTGLHKLNDSEITRLNKGPFTQMVNVQVDYGDPFEIRKRKPFDFFKFRFDLHFGTGRKILDNIIAYGFLYGKNKQLGKATLLVGAFQYYDYWDNKSFELGAVGLGLGTFVKLPVRKESSFYANLHFQVIPFSGNRIDSTSTKITDTSTVRDYNFGGGFGAKLECTLNVSNYFSISILYYDYIVQTYNGEAGYNFIEALKPRITFHLYKTLHFGIENDFYYNNRSFTDFSSTKSFRTEQRIFLQLFFEDAQRKGQYKL